MKYCVEIKQADQSYRCWWRAKEFDNLEEAHRYMDEHKECDTEYGQRGEWCYRIIKEG